ncbi:MAG: hypothetical protein J5825_00785 [Lachnospiraceae bacterium]|nr:hypothetical protein [Lachnospiraceae bacterium]
MIDRIVIEKDGLRFGDELISPPFTREKVDGVLGTPRIEEQDYPMGNGKTFHRVHYHWDSLGVYCSQDQLQNYYDDFVIDVAQPESGPDAGKPFFIGKVLIGKTEYTKAKFKMGEFDFNHHLRYGAFEVNTYLPDEVESADDPKMAKMLSTQVEVTYHAPRPKTSIYDLKKSEEPVLAFSSFPFKLLVMEELMYRQCVLEPKFDIYDFAEKNTKREIDVDDEGYDPIPAAKKWFRDYEIPAKYAGNITRLLWDGGLMVYHQIWPFWDGEDEYFHVKKLTPEEVAQFPNLKTIVGSYGFSKKALEVLKDQGIELEG